MTAVFHIVNTLQILVEILRNFSYYEQTRRVWLTESAGEYTGLQCWNDEWSGDIVHSS